MENKRFVSLVSDTTFKYLWKNDKTKPWMNGIIKAKTGIDLTDYDIIDGEQNSGNNILKDYRSDITLSNKKEIVIIEINDYYSDSVEIKGRYYLYRRAGNSFDKGEKYTSRKATLIMINNYLNKYDEECKLSNSWFGDHKLNVKYNDIEMFQIYLPTYRKMCYDNCNEVDKRLWLFGAESFEEMRKNVKNDSNLYIVEELERLSVNDKFIDEYDTETVNKKLINSLKSEGYNDGLIAGKSIGFDEGLNNGKKQEKIEIAKNLINLNVPINTIMEATGLTKEELEHLN